jgi:hypothetical protein
MRPLVLALPLLAGLPLHAETLSAEIGRTGLAAVETRLAALPGSTDEERFTLGGVQFLRAVEISFQDRWREGLTDNTGMLPLLRLPLADNPAPEPFQPGTIAGIFRKAGAELDLAKANLTAIPDTSDFGAIIALSDLWMDVNANGQRESGEALNDLLGMALDGGMATDPGAPAVSDFTIRFDAADAVWLAAYADMLNAFCNLVLAYDPTEPITRILAARTAMDKLGPPTGDWLLGGDRVPDALDMIAMVLATLDQPPDKARMAAVQTHLLDMVAENRVFWTRVALETDDNREWLPNPSQHAVLGIEVPPDSGPKWLAVLDEMEAVVQGRKLIPFWRVGAPAGINLSKVFADPPAVDLAGWIQGWAALPYLEQGVLASPEAMEAFDQATGGQSMLFALYFN